MSALDEIIARLNALLGGDALRKASELLKGAEMMLRKENDNISFPAQKAFSEEKRSGEQIPPRPQTLKRSPEEKRASPYAQIDFRREKEPPHLVQYRKLRSLSNRDGYERYSWKHPKSFFRQAQYMQTVAAEPCAAVNYESISADYGDLTIAQFRYYAALHPMLLDGDYSRIDAGCYGYLFLFFSELICGAAKPQESPKQVFSRLTGIVDHFISLQNGSSDTSFPAQQAVLRAKLYSFEYAMVKELREEALVYGDDVGWGVRQASLFPLIKAYEKADYKSLLTLFSEKCSYHIAATALCKAEPYSELYPLLFKEVLDALYRHSTTQKDFSEWLFGRMAERSYEPFSLLMADAVPEASFTFAPFAWICYSYDAAERHFQVKTHIGPNYDHISDVLRSMDFYMRIEVGGRQLQKPGLLSKTQDAVVAKAVRQFCEARGLLQLEQRKREQAKKRRAAQKKLAADPDAPMRSTLVEIDFSKLDQIRADAQNVEERLLSVYEQPEQTAQEAPILQPFQPFAKPMGQKADTAPAVEEDDDWRAFYNALEEGARRYLALLCEDRNKAKIYCAALCRESGKTPQLLLEEINALSLEYIGDTILSEEDETQIYEDYLDAAKAAFFRKEGA